jgi:diguanylate cyclase (GGDEF)-like protein
MPDTHSVNRATSLAGALKLLSEQEFDVALLDRSLPDVEGFSGLHNLQTMSPELPVIFLTGHTDEMTALEAIREGAQDYLFKDRMEPNVIKRAIQYAVLRKQFEHVLIVQANYDMLTGLANRLLFENRLELALAKIRRLPGSLVVLFLDLDGFKKVNDTFGHITGDQLLKEVGKRLKQVLRRYDTVARFGGDEFAILLEGVPDTQHGEVVAQKILHLFDEPFTISGTELDVGISIGIVTCESGQEANREVLMRQADEMMYQAKAMAGSAYCIYSRDAAAAD